MKRCKITFRTEQKKRPKDLTERRLAAALVRGEMAWRKLIVADGGAISSVEVAELLGISTSAVLRKYRTGKLLGWTQAGKNGVQFPRWQFAGVRPLPGLTSVIAALNQAGYLDDKARVLFFLSEFGFVGCRPLDLLRAGRVADALLAAKTYTE